MPLDVTVHDAEGPPCSSPDHPVVQRHGRLPPVALPVRGACVVRRLPRAVQVAQRTELVGRVPRVERRGVDDPRLRKGVDGGDVALRQRQHGHRLGRGHALLPLDTGVLDRGRPLVAVALDAQLEAHRSAREPATGLGREVARVALGHRRRGCRVRCGAEQVADCQVGSPAHRSPAPVRLGGDAGDGPLPTGHHVAQHPDHLAQPEQADQLQQPQNTRDPTSGCRLRELDELVGAARMGDGVVRHQEVVDLLRGDLDAQGHAAQVGLGVRLAGTGRVGEPDHRRVRRPGLGEARAQVLGQIDEPELGVLEGQGGPGVEGPVDGVRDPVCAGRLRCLQLDAHDVARQPLELEPLRLGGAPDRALRPSPLHVPSRGPGRQVLEKKRRVPRLRPFRLPSLVTFRF